MDYLQILAIWLHMLALVIAWGYYGILGRVVLPGLKGSLERPAQVEALVAIERRALPLVILSVVLFTATGTYLLFINPDYSGLGDFFASTWTTLILVKHLFVIGFIVLGVIVDRLIRRVGQAPNERARESTLSRLALSAEGATALGALIALLTAAAQVAAASAR